MSLTLRHEAPADRRAAETLVREAFWNVYKPGCDEHYYLHLLRQSPAFRPELTFVCEADGVLAGQIACASSSIELEAGGYLDTVTFGPLAVLPSFQGKGLARRPGVPCPAAGQALGEQAVVILGDPRHYGRYGFWCGERWGISLENGQYLPGLQAVELAPGSLANAAGRFREGFAYAPDAAALDAFDALFLVKEKAITDFQQEFQVMCSLGHEVIPNGFMQ